MKTQAIEALVRSSNGPLAALFACLLLQSQDKTFFGEEEIARVLDRTTKSTRKYIRQLSRLGFITRTQFHTGWILTFMGRQQLLEITDFQLQNGQNSEQLQASNPVKFTGLKKEETDQPGKNYRVGQGKWLDPVKFTGSDSVVVVNNIDTDLNLKQQQHETVIFTVSNPGLEHVELVARRMCQAAAMLLGEEIWPEKVVRWLLAYEQRRGCHAELDMLPGLSILAAWIAQLYHKPPRAYHSLAAICAANVISQRMPYAEYLCGWWNHTTEEFNEALFEVVECLECWGETCHCTDADG